MTSRPALDDTDAASVSGEIAPLPLSRWLFAAIGAGSAVFGLLPWLITGLRLPLQNLWAVESLPDDMPVALLPFSQYHLSLIAALIVVGSATAGIIARVLRARTPNGGLALLMLGVGGVHLVAVTQTAVVVAGGLRDDRMSGLYLTAITAVAVMTVALGLGVLRLIARAPRAGALIGLTVAALLTSGWVHALLSPQGPAFTGEPSWLFALVRWIPPVLIGAAIAWAGVNTVGRIIAAVSSLAMLWIGPALITAATAAVGSRVLARHLDEMLDYGIDVFRMALFEPTLVATPLVVAILVAAGGLVLRAVTANRANRLSRASRASGASRAPR
jgi:hypothetical protein